MKKGKIGPSDYAVLAVDNVCTLLGVPLQRPEGFDLVFAAEAAMAIAGPGVSLDHPALKSYGPLEEVVPWLGRTFPVPTLEGDVFNVQQVRFTWGGEASERLKRARIRLRLVNRLYEGFDRWRGDQAEIAPHLHDDVWKLLIAIITGLVGFLIGRYTAH